MTKLFEQWKQSDFQNLYVSNLGRVATSNGLMNNDNKSFKIEVDGSQIDVKEKEVIYFKTDSYQHVRFLDQGKQHSELVHRLVAKAFNIVSDDLVKKGLSTDDLTVDHLNEKTQDNNSYNLEWVEQRENNRRYNERHKNDSSKP